MPVAPSPAAALPRQRKLVPLPVRRNAKTKVPTPSKKVKREERLRYKVKLRLHRLPAQLVQEPHQRLTVETTATGGVRDPSPRIHTAVPDVPVSGRSCRETVVAAAPAALYRFAARTMVGPWGVAKR